MKKLKSMFIAALTLFSVSASAQDCNLPVYIQLSEEFTEVPAAACQNLYNALNRMAVENGLSTEAPTSPFVLTARCDVIDKSNLAGPPIQTVYNLGMTLYLADTYSQKIFGTAYIKLKGVGTGEVKSYINAFNKINSKSKEVQNFLAKSKKKMVDYYDEEYANIIKEAKRLESMQKYEEALAMVLSIPVCTRGGDEATAYGIKLYKANLDRMNLYLLNAAKALWASGQTQEAAYSVCAMLADIDPDASCYTEAAALMKEIKEQVRSDIDFEMRQKYNDEVDLEKQRIESARAVGVAFGNGQKQTTTNLMWMR